MYECDKQYESVYLKNNTEPKAGPCTEFDSANNNYKTDWPRVRKFCQRISLVWAVGGDIVCYIVVLF